MAVTHYTNIPLVLTTFNSPKHLETLGRAKPRRMTSTVFKSRVSRIQDRAERSLRLSMSRFWPVQSLQGRNDFGDLDFVLQREYAESGWQEKLARSLGITFWAQVPYTETFVFDDEGYQINVHVAPEDVSAGAMAEYLRFGSLGELLRPMYENLGLHMHNYHPTLKCDYPGAKPIFLDTHTNLTNVVLGYGSDQFQYEIFTKNDLFLMIRSCRYFNRQLYTSFAENPANAEVLAKNHLLRDFIAHLTDDPNTNRESIFVTASDTGKIWAFNLRKKYTAAFTTYLEEKQAYELKSIHAKKLNSEIVQNLTGLTSPEDTLKIINALSKKHKTPEAFNMYLTTSMPTTISQDVMKVFEELKPVLVPMQDPQPVVVPELAEVEKKPRAKSKSAPKLEAKPKASVKAAKTKKPIPKTVTEIPLTTASTEAPDWPMPSDTRYTVAA
jgi:hypothetical protein